MKFTLVTTFIAASLCSGAASAIEVKLSDVNWDGITIPQGQQCQKFGGVQPATPALQVSNIPSGSDSIILEYSDRDSEKMNHGGHGRMLYSIDSSAKIINIPRVAGHTYDLPEKFTMLEAHRGAGWDKEGAYMPPCSGGKAHAYYLTVKSMKGDTITATSVIELGQY